MGKLLSSLSCAELEIIGTDNMNKLAELDKMLDAQESANHGQMKSYIERATAKMKDAEDYANSIQFAK